MKEITPDIRIVADELSAYLPEMRGAAAEAEAQFIVRNKIRVLRKDSDLYPGRLRQIGANAPRVLFSIGAADLNARHVIGIVGTRQSTASGNEFTKSLVDGLAKALDRPVIVSGLAYGIDVTAHKTALAADTPTVAVVAHGLNTIYPAEHRDVARRIIERGGALVTEYPTSAAVHRSNFLARNRIIAGMCDVIVVAESASHGGALVTARHAATFGRMVCAAPARWNDSRGRGCNELIASGQARLITSASELIKLMGWEEKATVEPMPSFDFSAQDTVAQRIITHLRANPTDSIDQLSRSLAIPMADLAARMIEMEMDDLLIAVPGGRYELKV